MAIQLEQSRTAQNQRVLWPFTVDDYHKMVEVGILDKDARVELLNAEIVQMSPINVPHAVCVGLLNMALSTQVPKGHIVYVQNPIFIDEYNEPQPDLAVLKPADYGAMKSHPKAENIALVVEVADSTLQTDRKYKMPLYAQAGIPEAWLVNISGKAVEVHTEPVDGKYKKVQRFGLGRSISLTQLPDVSVSVADILSQK